MLTSDFCTTTAHTLSETATLNIIGVPSYMGEECMQETQKLLIPALILLQGFAEIIETRKGYLWKRSPVYHWRVLCSTCPLSLFTPLSTTHVSETPSTPTTRCWWMWHFTLTQPLLHLSQDNVHHGRRCVRRVKGHLIKSNTFSAFKPGRCESYETPISGY